MTVSFEGVKIWRYVRVLFAFILWIPRLLELLPLSPQLLIKRQISPINEEWEDTQFCHHNVSFAATDVEENRGTP